MSNKKFDIAYIRRYVQGDLNAKEMYELERAAHEDEMLMDMLLGMEAENANASVFPHQDIADRIAQRIARKGKRKIIPWRGISIAASLLVVAGFAYYALQHKLEQPDSNAPMVSETPSKSTEDKAVAQDSLIYIETPQKEKKNDPVVAVRKSRTPAVEAIDQQEIPSREDTTDALILAASDTPALVIAQTPIESVNVVAFGAQKKQVTTGAVSQVMIRGVSSVEQKKNTFVVGKVVDAASGMPIAGATIIDKASHKNFHTDSLGRFMAFSDSANMDLEVKAIGFERQHLLANTSELTIKLQPDEATLEEVVVGYGKVKKGASKPQPEEGWKTYRNYLKRSIKDSGLKGGKVVVVFDITPSGQPENIRVKRSANSVLDQKAIEIIRQGPTWKVGSEDKSIELELDFKK